MSAARRATRRLVVALFPCLVSCGATPPPLAPTAPVEASGLPRRARVHVDHVARTRTTDFEAARRELLAALSAKGLGEGMTYVLETDEPAYLSLRPFERYAELDEAGVRQKALDDAVGEATLARLDALTHATLVPPHKNEVWSQQTALTYAPAGGPTLATATIGRLVEHAVMPDRDDAYGEAVAREVKALEAARYPVTRAVYVSAYGSGRYVTLWLAKSREALETRLPPAAWAEEAKARSAAIEESEHTVAVRADLGSR